MGLSNWGIVGGLLSMNNIILIGGAPGVGKSTLTRMVSESLKLPWISTDTIREMMRKVVDKASFPELFHLDETKVSAEDYLSSHSAQEIFVSQNRESVEVWKGVKALMETDYVWKDYIIEGIAITPQLIASYKNENITIKPLFLVDKDQDQIRKIVFERGVWDDADTYSDEVKEKEIEWVNLYHEWIEREAKKYNFPIIYIDDRAIALTLLLKTIGSISPQGRY